MEEGEPALCLSLVIHLLLPLDFSPPGSQTSGLGPELVQGVPQFLGFPVCTGTMPRASVSLQRAESRAVNGFANVAHSTQRNILPTR